MGGVKNLFSLNRPINKNKLWWFDKEIKKKIRSNNIEDFEKELIELYKLQNSDELKYNKMPVRIKFGLKVMRGTFLVDIAGNLGNIYLELIDMGHL